MADTTADRKLDGEILADAQAQAERNIRKTECKAKEILEHAKKEAKEHSDRTIESARERAQAKAAIIEAGIEVEARRLALIGREKTIRAILDEALAEMGKRPANTYPDALIRLGAEALGKMTGASFIVTLHPEDAASLGEATLRGIAEQVKNHDGRQVNLAPAADPRPIAAGIIVETADGRQRIDNSFGQRARRLSNQLRLAVAEIIFPETG